MSDRGKVLKISQEDSKQDQGLEIALKIILFSRKYRDWKINQVSG